MSLISNEEKSVKILTTDVKVRNDQKQKVGGSEKRNELIKIGLFSL